MTTPRAGYCTLEDLAAAIPDLRLAELTSDSGDVPDADKTAQAIADAADVTDGYLAGVRGVVVPVTDPTLRAILRPRNVAIVKFHLFGRRDIDSRDDPTRVQYDKVMGWLEGVASKKFELPSSAFAFSSPESSGTGVLISSDEQVFGRDW